MHNALLFLKNADFRCFYRKSWVCSAETYHGVGVKAISIAAEPYTPAVNALDNLPASAMP
jgi:hypothetical protein